MAVKWQKIAEDGDRYDLQYRTAQDDKVREDHRLLHGTTLPPSDPFWDKYYPPNGWGCRCTVVQVRHGKYPLSDSQLAITRGDNATAGVKQQMFRFNPGKSMKLFPPKHPYFPKNCDGCNHNGLRLAYNPQSEKCKACEIISEQTTALRINRSRTEVRQYIKELTAKNVPMVHLSDGPIENIPITYQAVKCITGKPHKYAEQRNDACRNLQDLMKDAEYKGYSLDIKEEPVPGHGDAAKWHYYKIKLNGEPSFVIVKERKNGQVLFHAIQDKDHFDPHKIENPWEKR